MRSLRFNIDRRERREINNRGQGKWLRRLNERRGDLSWLVPNGWSFVRDTKWCAKFRAYNKRGNARWKVDKSFEKESINCVTPLIGVADFSYLQRTSELSQTRFIQIYKNSKFHHSFRTRSGATTELYCRPTILTFRSSTLLVFLENDIDEDTYIYIYIFRTIYFLPFTNRLGQKRDTRRISWSASVQRLERERV